MLEVLGFTFMALCGFGLGAALLWDAVRKRRVPALLASRPSHTDEAFMQMFFQDSPRRAEVAVRLRKILADNLEQTLAGLRPDDRLDEDLGTELRMNPDLFWAMEVECGIDAAVLDFEVHERDLAGLVTFEDLIRYVEERLPMT